MSVLSIGAQNAAASAVGALLNSGTLKLLSGATVRASVSLGSTAFGSPASGAVSAAGVPLSGSASSSGVVDAYELRTSGGSAVISGSCSESDADIVIQNSNLKSGQALQLAALSFGGTLDELLSVSASGRYVLDGARVPRRIKCDAGWVIENHFSVADQNAYLDGILARGFNATILMNIVHAGGSGWPNVNEPADLDGVQPFTGTALTTPNATYFAKVSSYIDRCLERSLTVFFFHTYMGAGGGADGWESEVAARTNQQCFDWGVYLATTFPQPNIVWMHGGDHTLSGTALTRFQQIVAGIQSVTRNRIAGAEWDGPDTIVQDQTGFTYGPNPATTDMQLGSFYGQGPSQNVRSYITADEQLRQATPLPVYMTEPTYVDAWYMPSGGRTREANRKCHHWALCAGSIGGTNFGEAERWDGQSGMLASLDDAPTLDQQRSFAFWDALSWWLMRPSGTSSSSPINGAGSYGSIYCGRTLIVSSNSVGDSFIAAAMTSDGAQIVAYVPPTGTSGTTFQVDLRSMAGSTAFSWWNPAVTEAETAIATYPNTDSARSFTTPGNNGTGTNDWYLVGRPA